MDYDLKNTKYKVDVTSNFKNNYKKISKQNKDKAKLKEVIEKLANKEPLEPKYRDHQLISNKTYKDCRECHLEGDWLLIYKYKEATLILLLFATCSHGELFN